MMSSLMFSIHLFGVFQHSESLQCGTIHCSGWQSFLVHSCNMAKPSQTLLLDGKAKAAEGGLGWVGQNHRGSRDGSPPAGSRGGATIGVWGQSPPEAEEFLRYR